jgi:hypothetical protein
MRRPCASVIVHSCLPNRLSPTASRPIANRRCEHLRWSANGVDQCLFSTLACSLSVGGALSRCACIRLLSLHVWPPLLLLSPPSPPCNPRPPTPTLLPSHSSSSCSTSSACSCSFALVAPQWDALKVQRPHVLNDFSFYRRNFGKMVEFNIPFPVLEQEANLISMFLAQPCPLTMHLVKKINVTRDERAIMVFANIANALCRAVTEEFQNPETLDDACSAMTCATLLYDHTTATGVFASKAIKISAVVDALSGCVHAYV